MGSGGYVKGSFDQGELAGKFFVIVEGRNAEEVAESLKNTDTGDGFVVNKILNSAFDIDYNVHKLTFQPVLRVDGDA